MGCQGSKAEKPQSGGAATAPGQTLLTSTEGSPKAAEAHREVPLPASGTPLATSVTESSPINHIPSNTVEQGTPMSHGSKSPSVLQSKTQSNATLKKQLTLCTDNKELDIMVMEFTSHDSTVGNAIGRNCKEMRWKVGYDRNAAPIDIKMEVQEHKIHSHEVCIETDGQPIFRGAGSHSKVKLLEDFVHEWPFRGSICGLNEVNYFEVRPAHSSHSVPDAWYPATITHQREDGCFEVTAQEPDGRGGFMSVKYPAVDKTDLREAGTRKPLLVPEKSLMLQVPKQEPSHAVISVSGESVTHHFGRLSPPMDAAKAPELKFQVTSDRGTVAANVGHSTLAHFVSGEVRAVRCEAERRRHSWTVQLGPFAEHKIEVTKTHTLGKTITMLVDGMVLVEASAAALGCQGEHWQCRFRFFGERVIDFEVFKTNKDGSTLNETANVKEKRRYVHECIVEVPNDWDFTNAKLSIDGTCFTGLPRNSILHDEYPISMEPRALMNSYGITTPYKVDPNAPSNLEVLANSVLQQADAGKHAAGGLFSCCCQPHVAKEEIVEANGSDVVTQIHAN